MVEFEEHAYSFKTLFYSEAARFDLGQAIVNRSFASLRTDLAAKAVGKSPERARHPAEAEKPDAGFVHFFFFNLWLHQ